MIITKVYLKELKEFYYSDLCQSLDLLPVSKNRVESFINNPRAEPDDLVLVLAHKENRLLAFRTVLPDFFEHDGKVIRFAWLSGNWVSPEHRRKGLSTKLFSPIYDAWKAKLAYTNYAPESKMVYDKTGEFSLLCRLQGRRFYRRFTLEELMKPKKGILGKISGFWRLLDSLLNTLNDYRLAFYSKSKSEEIVPKTLSEIDSSLIEESNDKKMYYRDLTAWNWIDEYPWIKSNMESLENSNRYYFTCYFNDYLSGFYAIFKDDKTKSLVRLSIRNNRMKVAYVFDENDLSEKTSKLLTDLMNIKNLNYLTIYDQAVINHLKKRKEFWHSKKFTQRFFATQTLIKELPHKPKLQSGDGDGVFA